MKILTTLIEKANDTMDEIHWYAEKAMHLRTEHKALADVYIKIADMHVSIYGMLHDRMVNLIEEERKKNGQPPQVMLAIWEYEHEKMAKEFAESRFLIEEYKKMGY